MTHDIYGLMKCSRLTFTVDWTLHTVRHVSSNCIFPFTDIFFVVNLGHSTSENGPTVRENDHQKLLHFTIYYFALNSVHVFGAAAARVDHKQLRLF